MLKFKYKPITNKANFGGKRSGNAIKFIAIHWTSNQAETATANNHYLYFQNHSVGASAHYFVDENEIIQIIGDSTVAFAVGGNQGYGVALNGCTNYNSISIEMCVNEGYSDKMLYNTIELVKELKRLYPKAKICRHWDATRKDCPSGFTGNNNKKWNWFLSEVAKPRKLILDLSKDSEAKEVNSVKKSENINKPYIVIYKGDGDMDCANILAHHFGCEKIRDDGTINTSKYGGKDKYNIIYIGEGKNRAESAKIALNKYIK